MLVGAGPGDAGLITVAGLEALRQADVVVFDALANPELLAHVRPGATLIDCGKRAKAHKLTQDETNALLVEHAQAGAVVVRLKGGDPYLFGRGAEELTYCFERGVVASMIPGITAGIAAPAMAGIPVTHRKIASTLTIVTGHEDPTKPDTAVDYPALAALIAKGGTVCFYMGVGRLPLICESLIANALPISTPISLVQWGTLPKQRHVAGTLESISADVAREGISSPAIIVVGAVAGMDEPGLHFFTNRPLFGQRIVVTRTRQQASSLSQSLRALGAEVLEAPTIAVSPPEDWESVDRALGKLSEYDAIAFTSTNAVDAMCERLHALNLDARALAGLHISAIGHATAQALRDRLGIVADLVPSRGISDVYAQELLASANLSGKRLLHAAADIARPGFGDALTAAGVEVQTLTFYRTGLAPALPQAVTAALLDGDVDWVTFTSSSTATNMAELLGGNKQALTQCKIASIGPMTSATMRALGLPPTLEADRHDVAGLVEAIRRAQGESRPTTSL